MVPKTWVKFVVGIFLLPFVWVLTKTFAETLGFSLHHGLLGTKGCLFFLGGIVLWALAFWLSIRLIAGLFQIVTMWRIGPDACRGGLAVW